MDAEATRFGQYSPAVRTLLHLSDTHLLAGNPLLGDRYDTMTNLARTLERVEEMRLSPDAIVFTGDLADRGEPEAYRTLREMVEPVAERMSAPLVWVAGNHDERSVLRTELLGAEPSQAPIVSVHDVAGLRLIALDTTVPGWHHGDFDDEQLRWLSDVLSTPAPLGTVLAMHHPPLPSHLPVFDILELREQTRLAEVIEGTDVRAILAGHLHYSTSGTFAGIPVSVASATCYTMNLARPASAVNGMDAGQSFHLVQVYDETITHSVVPVVDASTADFFSADWVREMSARTPQQRLEAFSRKR
ncbi:phosphodiesterase [Microbacterium sp. NPDC076911]|uniref:phosphodiesterase n=1 Tax=Microbacterium sp. NPDC076911 TaxID=3154958 RepID=UPI00341857ED